MRMLCEIIMETVMRNEQATQRKGYINIQKKNIYIWIHTHTQSKKGNSEELSTLKGGKES